MKRYLKFHGEMLLLLAAFALYAYLVGRFLPEGFYHCFLHDVLHLYCPFCGGTRMARALLHLRFKEAFFLNPALFCYLVFLLALDVRALIILLRKQKKSLLPPFVFSVSVAYFAAYTGVRNMLLFFGVDTAGELAPYWEHLTRARATAGGVLFLLLTAAVTLAVLSVFPKGNAAFWTAAAVLLPLLLFVLSYRFWWISLFIPLLAVLLWSYRITHR